MLWENIEGKELKKPSHSETNIKEDITDTIKCQHPSQNIDGINETIAATDDTVYKNNLFIRELYLPPSYGHTRITRL